MKNESAEIKVVRGRDFIAQCLALTPVEQTTYRSTYNIDGFDFRVQMRRASGLKYAGLFQRRPVWSLQLPLGDWVVLWESGMRGRP